MVVVAAASVVADATDSPSSPRGEVSFLLQENISSPTEEVNGVGVEVDAAKREEEEEKKKRAGDEEDEEDEEEAGEAGEEVTDGGVKETAKEEEETV